jgi:hypothetical protein
MQSSNSGAPQCCLGRMKRQGLTASNAIGYSIARIPKLALIRDPFRAKLASGVKGPEQCRRRGGQRCVLSPSSSC